MTHRSRRAGSSNKIDTHTHARTLRGLVAWWTAAAAALSVRRGVHVMKRQLSAATR
jgi:hypothetical protein